MESVEKFTQKVKGQFNVRTVLPFGAPVVIGSVGVVENGLFEPRGTVKSILGVELGSTSTGKPADWQLTSGRDVGVKFLAHGEASSLFPAAPKANAKIEISFSKGDSFLCTLNDLTISTLQDPAVLIKAMLDAYKRGVWRRDFVLIYETVTPSKALVLLSKNAGTNILLAANAKVKTSGLANVAGKFAVTYQSQDVVNLSAGRQPLFYNAYRVKTSFWTGSPRIAALAARARRVKDVFVSV
jgi:hypothetical protein